MEKPNALKKWLWVSIIFIIIAAFYPIKWFDKIKFSLGRDSKTEMILKSKDQTIDSLMNVVRSYEDRNKKLTESLLELDDDVLALKATIQRRENTIANLKKETNERVSTVTKFNTSDIYKFLSDRYKDSTSVK
jgi:septal ring factor EnvC (AmiA/AmiB activator)